MEERNRTIFEFGPFRLDPTKHQLSRQGEVVSLTPKALDTLIFLVENSGRTLTKEELMGTIWPDTSVEESNLTQTIFVLRKALGESSDHPRYILTLPRTGYRFIAAVRVVSPADDDSAESPAAAPSHGAKPGTGKGSDSDWQGSRRRFLRPAILGIAMAAVVALALLLTGNRTRVGPFATEEFVSSGSERARSVGLALAPLVIEEREQDGELQLLAISITDLLGHRLSLIPDLVLLFSRYGAISEEGAFDLESVARQAGSEFLLGGRLSRSSDSQKGHLTITLQKLSEGGPGETILIGQFDIPFLQGTTDVSRFLTIRDQIIERMLTELLPAIELTSESGIAPSHPEAYRLYLSGLNRLRQASCAGETALGYLSPSLQMDPDFAPAWEAFGWAHYNLASFCGQSAKHYEEALKAADRALSLTPNWARAIALRSTVLVESGRIADAYAQLVEARRRPELASNPNIEFLEAYVLRYSGYLGEARKRLERVLEREPIFLSAEGWTPNTLLYQGDLEGFLRVLPATNTPIFRYYRGFALYLEQDRGQALEVLAPAFVSNPNDTFARLSESLKAIIEGRPAEAQLQLKQLALQRSKLGSGDGEVTYKIAQLLILADDYEAGLEQLSLSVAQGFFNYPYLRIDPVLSEVQAVPQFQEILLDARDQHLAFGRRFGLRAE